MRAMVLRGKQLTIEEVAKPSPGPGQVLARVLACGICGSDLHAAKYMEAMMAASAASGRSANQRDMTKGMVMGHEFVAEVVEAGPGAEAWTAGTRVTSFPILIAPPPQSETGVLSIGYSTEIPGAYGEYVVLSAALLLKVPDNVPDKVGATTEPCAVGLHAVREARIKPGERVLIMGAGPIGMMTLLWLKKEGASFVVVSDPAPERRALAQRMGADVVLNPAEVNMREALAGILPAPRPSAPGFGPPPASAPDVVFECVGVEGTLQQAMELVQVHGRVIVVGVCMNEDRILPMVGINKQLSMQFVLGYTVPEYAEALVALGDGSIDTAPLVTRTVSLAELPAAFQSLADPKDCKVVVLPNG
jgi:threonine dehydrogenase-like Zn-dependent dehydrogenase